MEGVAQHLRTAPGWAGTTASGANAEVGLDGSLVVAVGLSGPTPDARRSAGGPPAAGCPDLIVCEVPSGTGSAQWHDKLGGNLWELREDAEVSLFRPGLESSRLDHFGVVAWVGERDNGVGLAVQD